MIHNHTVAPNETITLQSLTLRNIGVTPALVVFNDITGKITLETASAWTIEGVPDFSKDDPELERAKIARLG
jgi:hypothetical protein